MNCRDCSAPLPVDRTLKSAALIVRVHTCACGSRWESEQKIARRLPALMPAGAATNAGSLRVRPPPARTGNPLMPATGVGGVGGGLPSDQDLGSDPTPILSKTPDQTQARAESNGAARYPEAFEGMWKATGQTGRKMRALKAWRAQGRPAAGLVAAGWARWAQTDEWRRGYVPHVSTWLNDRGWEDDPQEPHRETPGEAEARQREEAAARARAESAARIAATDRKAEEYRRYTHQAPPAHAGALNGASVDIRSQVAALASAKALGPEDEGRR